MKDVTCTGQLGEFDHSGDDRLRDIHRFRAAAIQRSHRKSSEAQHYLDLQRRQGLGSGSWRRIRSHRHRFATNKEDVQKDIFNILRNRIDEKRTWFCATAARSHYYQEADWVEMVDSDNRTIRIAIARNSHLPVRKIVETRDANTRMRTEESNTIRTTILSRESKRPSRSPANATTSRSSRPSSKSANTTPAFPTISSPENLSNSAGNKSARRKGKEQTRKRKRQGLIRTTSSRTQIDSAASPSRLPHLSLRCDFCLIAAFAIQPNPLPWPTVHCAPRGIIAGCQQRRNANRCTAPRFCACARTIKWCWPPMDK